jgi:Sugar phosphate isomerases/epimerases
LRSIASLGYRGLEIAPTRLCPERPYENIDVSLDFKQHLENEYGLKICSMQSIWYGRSENIFIPDEAAILLELTEQALHYADAIGCPNLVFGCPKNRSLPPTKTIEDAYSFFNALAGIAEEHRARIAIEPNPAIYQTNFLNTTTDAYRFLSSLPSYIAAAFSINLDLGTILANDEPLDSLIPIIPFVSHVHISEPHLAPIQARDIHYQLKELLEDQDYQGYISLEMASADRRILNKCLEYVAEVFS